MKSINSLHDIRNTLNTSNTATPSSTTTENLPIPQSDSSFTVSSSGGLSSSAPLPNT